MRLSLFWALLLSVFTFAASHQHEREHLNRSLEKRARAQVFTRCTVPNTVALTFDDGPYWYLTDLVNTLNKAKVKATFFFNGNNWACIYNDFLSQSVKFAYDSGHQVASHTWGHKNLTQLTWDQIHDQMWRTEQALIRITGATPAFMRPPYGNYSDLVLDAAGVRGQAVVNWDFGSEDGKSATVAKQKALYDAIVVKRPSTILSLQHEVYNTSVYQVLPYAISKLQSAGYKFVTVADCLGKKPYQSVVAPAKRDANWIC